MSDKYKNNKARIMLVLTIMSMLILVWYINVKRLNAEKKVITKYYELNETIKLDILSYKITKFRMYDADSLKREYKSAIIASNELFDKFIVSKVEVTNTGTEPITTDFAMQCTQSNFESLQWLSTVNLWLVESLNSNKEEYINPGETFVYFSATNISPACFSKKGWENIENERFDCVISLYPNSVRINLGIPEVIK